VGGGGERLDRRPPGDEPLEPRLDGSDRRLLEHDFAQPYAVWIGRQRARGRTPRKPAEVIHIMLKEALGGVGGHLFAMAWSRPMSKRLDKGDSPRTCRAQAAGDLVGDIGGQSFKRFGFVQHSIVSRWSEIVGARYAKVS